MTVDPTNYDNPEMEIWLLTYLYYNRRDQSVVSRDLLENLPPSLLKTLPKQDHLHYMVTRFIRAGYFREAIGTFRAGSNYHLFITDKGIMEFRKQLLPLYHFSKNPQKISDIIDKNVGDAELKQTILEFFQRTKNCNQDEFDFRLHEFTHYLGKESVIWIYKLILASSK